MSAHAPQTPVRITARRFKGFLATVLAYDAPTGLYDLRVAASRDEAPPSEYDTKCATVRLGPNQFYPIAQPRS